MATRAHGAKPPAPADPKRPGTFLEFFWELLGDQARVRRLGLLIAYLSAGLTSAGVLVLLFMRAIDGVAPAYVVPSGVIGTSLIAWAVDRIKKKVKGRRRGPASGDTPAIPR